MTSLPATDQGSNENTLVERLDKSHSPPTSQTAQPEPQEMETLPKLGKRPDRAIPTMAEEQFSASPATLPSLAENRSQTPPSTLQMDSPLLQRVSPR